MTNEIQLKFPLTNGGEEDGFNHSGIEHFLGNPHYYVARECGQNVGDVIRKGVDVAELRFELIDVPASDIPCLDRLKQSLSLSNRITKDPKGKEFFKRAIKHAQNSHIKVLKVSDYGTTGLGGNDEDRDGGWYGLVRSGGVTNKFGGDEGGGFGIGKFAVFASSGFRTVFYSSRTESNEVAFQGVSHLVSHEAGPHMTQGTGYIGHYNDRKKKFSAIRRESEIPGTFIRQETGLDIYVLDFIHDEDWESNLTRSILQNFWPAIHFGRLRFGVAGTTIDRQALPDLMSKYAGDDEFEAYYHYQSVDSAEALHRKTTLRHLGKVEVYLVKGNDQFPRSIARVRKSGMIIDKRRTRSRVPYAGLFVCENAEGNKLLKKMEPPRHDQFQPERAKPKGKPAIDELNKWLVKCVKELNPVLSSETLEIPELYRYLPDTGDDDTPFQDTGSGDTEQESFDRKVDQKKPEVTSSAQLNVHVARVEADDDIGTGGSGGKTENADDEGGDGTSAGDGTGDGSGGQAGENDGQKQPGPKREIRIETRTIATSETAYPIMICLRPDESFAGSVALSAVGEDGSDSSLSVTHVEVMDGPDCSPCVVGGNRIDGLQLSSTETTRIKLAFETANKVAVKVTGKRNEN